MKPIIFHEGSYTRKDIEIFKREYPIWNVADRYEIQLQELFAITYPEKIHSASFVEECALFCKQKMVGDVGDWIYYPWSGVLVHSVSESDFFALRTNRNQLLITAQEQEQLYRASVGVVGLSVGSAVVRDMVYSGCAKNIKLAEYDTIDTTNLNRVQAKLSDVGREKIELCTESVYEINPYAHVQLFSTGLHEETLTSFFEYDGIPAVVFEVIDDFQMKIRLRMMAKKYKVPVVMLTNLGDNLLVDVERFDIEPSRPLFHGLLDTVIADILNGEITPEKKKEFAVRLVDVEHVPPRALETLAQIGTTLVGRPQLMSTVAVSGGVGSYIMRQICLDGHMPSGRYFLKIDSLFGEYGK